MQNSRLKFLITLLILLAISYQLRITGYCAEEEDMDTFTITTYYPSPYGSYNELTTYSNTYLAIKGGNVGIGTTNPIGRLDVRSTGTTPIYWGDTTGAALGYLGFSLGSPDNPDLIIASTGLKSRLVLGSSGQWDAVVISQLGNVGIGAANPIGKLDVRSTGTTPIYWGDTTGAALGYLGFSLGSPDNPDLIIASTSRKSRLVLGSSGQWDAVVISQSGNVGIGAEKPTVRLEIAGGIRLNTATAKPVCNDITRGTIWNSLGGVSQQDQTDVCLKKSDGTYNWQKIAGGDAE